MKVGGKWNNKKRITTHDMNQKQKNKECTSAQVTRYEQKKTSKNMLVQKIWAKENKQKCISANMWKYIRKSHKNEKKQKKQKDKS